MKPFPIAYLINQYPKVSHSFIRRELRELERQGWPVLRIALRGWDAPLADAADLGERAATRYVLQRGLAGLAGAVLRQCLRAPLRSLAALRLALRLARQAERPWPLHLAYLAEACRILPWLRRAGVRHVHAHFGTNAAEIALLAHALGGPPFSFTVHGPEEFDQPAALHLADKVRRAAFVVAISSFGRSQLYRCVEHAAWPKVRVVHCALDADFHAGAEVPLPQAPRLVCVGRLCEQKGQLLLLDALQRLARRGLAFQMVLAGDGDLRGQLEERIAAYGLGHMVRITGWISGAQVRHEILAARALVLPSFAEGLPVVIMEAMALRRPVLSTYVAGIPELVTPGENGWLFPAGDVDALAAMLETCLATSTRQLRRMGALGRLRALQRHDVQREVAKLAGHFVAAQQTQVTQAAQTPQPCPTAEMIETIATVQSIQTLQTLQTLQTAQAVAVEQAATTARTTRNDDGDLSHPGTLAGPLRPAAGAASADYSSVGVQPANRRGPAAPARASRAPERRAAFDRRAGAGA